MNAKRDVIQLPGNMSTAVFYVQIQQKLDIKPNVSVRKPASPEDLLPEYIDLLYSLNKLSKARPKTLSKEMWSRKCPEWDKKNDKNDKAKAQFKAEMETKRQFLKENVGNIKQNAIEELKRIRDKVYIETDNRDQEFKQLQYKGIEINAERDDFLKVPLNIIQEDVFSELIPVSQFLKLFLNTYKYDVSVEEYLKQFEEIGKISRAINRIGRIAHRKKITFKQFTVDGQLRARYLNQADLYNQKLLTNFNEFSKLCSGNFYCPDKYFTTPYEELPPKIQSYLTIQMMKNKTKYPLYALIGAGEAVNYLTFESELFGRYVKSIKQQFDKSGTWEPFTFYQKALEVKKAKDRTKGVAPFYSRCGYETYLMINAESIVLYFLIYIVQSRKQLGQVYLNGSEFVVFKEKVQNSIIDFDTFDKQIDNLWINCKEFVLKRTGGVVVKKIDYDAYVEENAYVAETYYLTTFEYGGYGIDYATGEVYKQSEESIRRQEEETRRMWEEKARREEEEKARKEAEMEAILRAAEAREAITSGMKKADDEEKKEEEKAPDQEGPPTIPEKIEEVHFIDPFADPPPDKPQYKTEEAPAAKVEDPPPPPYPEPQPYQEPKPEPTTAPEPETVPEPIQESAPTEAYLPDEPPPADAPAANAPPPPPEETAGDVLPPTEYTEETSQSYKKSKKKKSKKHE